MSSKNIKSKKSGINFIYTVSTVLILCLLFLGTIGFIYNHEEAVALENLHVETKQIKDDIQLQIHSDKENLSTIASFAEKLYADGKDINTVFHAFESIGLIEKLVILLPDNTLISRKGEFLPDIQIDFEEELKKGEYTSGRVLSFTPPARNIVRNAVHITHEGEVIGILYGIIELDKLQDRYSEMVEELNAQLYIYENGNGAFIVDSFHNQSLDNINDLKNYTYKKGYTFDQMRNSQKGFTSVESKYLDQYIYMHYSPLDIGDWQIMLGRTEDDVFHNARRISMVMMIIFLLIVLTLSMYLIAVFHSERRKAKITASSSAIRKMLLDINSTHSNIINSLKRMCFSTHSKFVIFADTDGEEHFYELNPSNKNAITEDQKNYLISQLLKYSLKQHSEDDLNINLLSIKRDSELEKANKRFYDFMTEKEIDSLVFSSIRKQDDNHISVLCMVNPKKQRTAANLLTDISVCFSIAIYNKKHLNKTEIAASTDSLTGLLNRVSYNKAITEINDKKPNNLACVYIDVNGLHIMNNKYGHAAGDEMLIYVSNTLKEVFYGCDIFRYGGDEFIVFVKNAQESDLKRPVSILKNTLAQMNYHIAAGTSFRATVDNAEELVREAEVGMYENKANFYRNKHDELEKITEKDEFLCTSTGIKEIDTIISTLSDHYYGLYKVSLNTDSVHRILMPAYLEYNEDENDFKEIFNKYISDWVNPDFHRSMDSFINYDALKKELILGNIPKISYKKIDGSPVILSVYPINTDNDNFDTMWIFEKGIKGEQAQ